MNKKWLWGVIIFGIVAVAIGGVVYFNFKSKTAKDFVPASSNMVMRVNFSEIQKIASISEFSKLVSKFTGESFGDENNLLNIILETESKKEGSTGLDLKSDGYIFSMKETEDENQNVLDNGLIFSIKDKATWETFLKTNKQALKETSDLKFEKVVNCNIFHSSKAQTYAWNSNVVLFIGDVVDNSKLNSFFSSSEDKAIKLPQFKKFLDKKSHVSIYVKDMNSLSNQIVGASALLSQQKPSGFAAYVNFENGKIKMDGEMLGSAEVLKQFDFFSSKPVSEKLLSMMQDSDPTGLFSIHLDMDKVLAFVAKNESINTAIKLFLSSKGLTINDLKQIFSGEIVYTINFINPTSDEYMGMSDLTPQMHVLIGSKNPEKLKGVLDDLGLVKFGDNAWQAGMGGSNINVVIKNNSILITNNDANAKNFNEGFAGIPLKDKIIEKGALASPNYIYFNLKKFLLANPAYGSGFISQGIGEQIEFLEMKGDYSKMNGAIHLKDKSQNSLKTIMNILKEMNLRPEHNENDFEDELQEDSAYMLETEKVEDDDVSAIESEK